MNRQQIINEAIKLLDAGLLPSALPLKLMSRFKLRKAEAQDVAQAALRERKKAKKG